MYKLCISRWNNSIPKLWCNATQNTWAVKTKSKLNVANKNSAPKANLLSATLVVFPFLPRLIKIKCFCHSTESYTWTELLSLRVAFKQNERIMRCFQALLLPCFQYFQYFCNIFQYFQYIFCTFFVLSEYLENKGQNWTKNKLGFLLYELLHQYICGFL